MKKYFNVLRKCTLFNGIADDDISALLGCLGARVEKFGKKYTIFAEGDRAQHFGIVLSGSVQIVQMDFYGNRSILSAAQPSETFAEAFACAGTESIPVSAVANEASEVMLVDCSRILYSCTNNCGFHRQIIFNLMKELAEKNINFHQKIEITSKRSTKDKLLAYLALCAKKNGSNSFYIPYDRQELADFLEVDRSGLSAEISKLRKEGVLESDKNHFVLK